jgi:hypothetical protein
MPSAINDSPENTYDANDGRHVPQHVPAGPADPDLARVVIAWPDLPSHIKAAVLALVGTGR